MRPLGIFTLLFRFCLVLQNGGVLTIIYCRVQYS